VRSVISPGPCCDICCDGNLPLAIVDPLVRSVAVASICLPSHSHCALITAAFQHHLRHGSLEMRTQNDVESNSGSKTTVAAIRQQLETGTIYLQSSRFYRKFELVRSQLTGPPWTAKGSDITAYLNNGEKRSIMNLPIRPDRTSYKLQTLTLIRDLGVSIHRYLGPQGCSKPQAVHPAPGW
jgi:hypothetical protein